MVFYLTLLKCSWFFLFPFSVSSVLNAQPVLNPGNGHWYEFVAAQDITWSNAKIAAESNSFTNESDQSFFGYLATITSDAEEAFLKTHFGTNALVWIGASDAAVEGEWRWVTGPEAAAHDGKGLFFWLGGSDGTAVGYANWIRREPNALGADEDYIDWNHNRSGGWNDIANNTPRDVISGYFVEYGELVPEPTSAALVAFACGVMAARFPRPRGPRRGTTIAAALGVLSGLLVNGAADAEPAIWPGNGHAYEFVLAERVNWPAAQAAAVTRMFGGQQGYLATVTSADENTFIAQIVSQAASQFPGSFEEVWLGGLQPSRALPPNAGWMWITGEPWVFANWDSGEANDCCGDEQFIGMWGPSGRGGDGPLGSWNDQGDPDAAQVAQIKGYIVEYAVPEPGSIVLAMLAFVPFMLVARFRSSYIAFLKSRLEHVPAGVINATKWRYGTACLQNATRILSAIVVVAVGQTANSQPVPFNGHYYEYVGTTLNWTAARDAAAARSHGGVLGHLATATTQAENDFLFSLRPAPTQTFLGAWIGVKVANVQTWDVGPEAGSTLAYKNWGGGEPNNGGAGQTAYGYLHIGSGSYAGISPGNWADAGNGITSGATGSDPVVGYFVEYEAIPEPTSAAFLVLGSVLTLPTCSRQVRRLPIALGRPTRAGSARPGC
jgi:hypothetical protein